MKDKIFKFLKNKINITLIVLQVLAVISFLLGSFVGFFSSMFFVFEGAFFIVWGIKSLLVIKDSRFKQEIYEQLPYDRLEKERIRKQTQNSERNNKFMGIFLILFGVILIFSLFSVIF